MGKCIMLIGIPGSGKSEYAKKYLLKDNTVYLSSDDLRVELFGFEDQTHNDELFKELDKRCLNALKLGKDVIYDATNLSRKRRKHFIKTTCKDFDIEAILFCCSINTIKIRNITRKERHIPDDKIQQLISNIDVPLYYEGFKNIYLINSCDNLKESIDEDFELCVNFNQLNPHHNEFLFGHQHTVLNYILDRWNRQEYTELFQVAIYHDLGKLYTQTFDNNGIAHYYRHEKISAYIYMCACAARFDNKSDIVLDKFNNDVAVLITHHMDLFNPSVNKLERLLGDRLFDLLQKFHEADVYRG